ncbi:MAG: aromatic ring-hydroxylating dioxygenase subunit alpha [Rhodobacteraceae bacterium]|nr:aromatic ring-hydroxylating dioxygenase subunit alpha [Paracoccaceae bacterium]
MLDSALRQSLQRCRAPVAEAVCLPPQCYASDAVTLAEHDLIFRASWLGVGRADIVRNPGDYVTLDIAGQAVILLRDKEGRLRAFANSCRHRAARLLDGTGTCRGIRCPFHSWAYHLDGRLAAAPRMEDAPGFDRADYGLTTYPAEERAGFAFVSFNPAVADIDSVLGDFESVHSPWPLAGLVSTRRRETRVGCNWKAFLDVFNDYYHLPFVHPDSINDVYAEPDPATQVAGQYATQFGATEGTGGLLQSQQQKALPQIPGLNGREAHGVRYTWVFPNMAFAAGTDALWVYEAYPLGADQCHVVQTACFPPETLALPGAEEKIAAYHDRLDAALDEDIAALMNQQRGLACPDARQGRFQPLLEPNVAAFAAWYATKMTEPTERG